MGEFVGIDPHGAQELIRRMEAGKGHLGRTRAGLDAAIAEAGQDWAGRQGATAMHRAWAFFDESQHDLKWRIDTIEQIVPVRERGMLTGTFPFGSEAEAVRSAAEAAHSIRATLDGGDPAPPAEGSDTAPPTKDGDAVLGAEVRDPAYAAALLTALGPDAFTRALGGPDRALGGGLAEAFASAERTGRLGDEWYELVGSAPPGVLTSLVTLAGQSGTFLNRVAVGLLNRPPDPAWSMHDLVRAYEDEPLALQQLLAEHPSETRALLDAATRDPSLEEALAGALHEALKPGVGADGLRERAWRNIVRGVGAAVEIEDR
ncbi:hypothetical protein [Nonomuraea insulae]|uniref:DUF222 domain-containing protein n=1 Tax=Nonomuraea insulae TaxID=1616787 RepID=A0ABW1CG94_9ACTN